jgi:hypothetical protein
MLVAGRHSFDHFLEYVHVPEDFRLSGFRTQFHWKYFSLSIKKVIVTMQILFQSLLLLASLAAPAAAQDICGVCANGGKPGMPDKNIFGIMTCGETDAFLSTNEAAGADCAVMLDFYTLDAYTIPIGAFCGCEGEVLPCSICGNGGAVGNLHKVVSETTEGPITCGNIDLLLSSTPADECAVSIATFSSDLDAACGCAGVDSIDTGAKKKKKKKKKGLRKSDKEVPDDNKEVPDDNKEVKDDNNGVPGDKKKGPKDRKGGQ